MTAATVQALRIMMQGKLANCLRHGTTYHIKHWIFGKGSSHRLCRTMTKRQQLQNVCESSNKPLITTVCPIDLQRLKAKW